MTGWLDWMLSLQTWDLVLQAVRIPAYAAIALCLLYLFQYHRFLRWLMLALAIFFTNLLIAVTFSIAGRAETYREGLRYQTVFTLLVLVFALYYVYKHRRGDGWK